MTTTSRTDSTPAAARPRRVAPDRGVFIHPLLAVVALAPWLAFHAIVCSLRSTGEAAYEGLRSLLTRPMGPASWAPAIVVAFFLVLAHLVGRSTTRIRPLSVLALYGEAAAWAVPLLAINRLTLLSIETLSSQPWAVEVAGRVGAGLYEEFLFRAVLVTGMIFLGSGLLRVGRNKTAALAVVMSAFMFAACHDLPQVWTALASPLFIFRFVSGIYLGAVFWFRGYGAAAGGHVAYNLIIGAV